MKYNIKYSCISHIGKHRAQNQDNFFCDGRFIDLKAKMEQCEINGVRNNSETSLFAVFDGMGGEERGEIAAFIAAQSAAGVKWSRDIVSDITGYCETTNREIYNYSRQNGFASMGTTAAILAFTRKNIMLCNVGDSKIFLLSEKHLKQISKDHVISIPFVKKPLLTQNLGMPPEEMSIEPYISMGEYHDGDRYLICSDGLTDMLEMDDMWCFYLDLD